MLEGLITRGDRFNFEFYNLFVGATGPQIPNFMKLECQGAEIYTFPVRARAFLGNKSQALIGLGFDWALTIDNKQIFVFVYFEL